MKNLIVATFVIIALGLTFKCEAKALFLFPSRIDYKQDKTNDGVVKTLVYASPFSGKTYNVDYLSRWNFQAPPLSMPTMRPISMPTMRPLSMPSYNKVFNWDVNWNFNHGTKQVEETTTKPTTTTTTTEASVASSTASPSSGSGHYNGHHGHKNFDVNWSFDLNHGGASNSQSTAEKPSSAPVTKADDASDDELSLDDEDNDIDPASN